MLGPKSFLFILSPPWPQNWLILLHYQHRDKIMNDVWLSQIKWGLDKEEEEKEDKRQVLEGTFLHRPVDVPPSSLSSLANIVG